MSAMDSMSAMSELGLPRVSMKMAFVLSLTASSSPFRSAGSTKDVYKRQSYADVGERGTGVLGKNRKSHRKRRRPVNYLYRPSLMKKSFISINSLQYLVYR